MASMKKVYIHEARIDHESSWERHILYYSMFVHTLVHRGEDPRNRIQ